MGGGGGDNTGKQIAGTVATIALVAAGQAYGPALIGPTEAGGIGLFSAKVASAVAAGVGGAIGGAVSSALIGQPSASSPAIDSIESDSTGREGTKPKITGTKNRANRFGAIPKVLGKYRMYPTLAATPSTEIEGGDQYYRMLLTCGYGPVEMWDFRIGKTSIDEFDGIEKEVRKGFDDDNETNLYPNQINQNDLRVKLDDEGWIERTTELETDEITVDVTFPRGLVRFDDKGRRRNYSVTIEVEYKDVEDSTWNQIESREVSRSDQRRFSISFRQSVDRSQYNVRVRKVESNQDDPQIKEEAFWSSLRSITNEDPININKNLSLIALRIKATDQLNGQLDSFNCMVQTIGKSWNSEKEEWESEKKINNCADIYRHLLENEANPASVSKDQLDLESIQDWHENCEADKRTYNDIIDFKNTVFPTLKDICTAGRADYGRIDGKYSVIQDKNISTPKQHLTPRNSWGFEYEKMFPDFPDAWRIKFVNENKDYKEDSRIVIANDVKEENVSRIEEVEFTGVTDPDQVWKLGIHHIASMKNRPEIMKVNVDPEYLAVNRGDPVRFEHDVMLIGLGSGRVVRIDKDGDGDITGCRVDEKFERTTDNEYNVRIRLSNGEQVLKDIDNDPDDPQEIVFDEKITDDVKKAYFDDEILVQFGESGKESIQGKVTKILTNDEMTAEVHMVDLAPEIHSVSEPPIPDHDPEITPLGVNEPPIVVDVRSDADALISDDELKFHQQIRVTLETRPTQNLDQIEKFQIEWRYENENDYNRKEVDPDKRHVFIGQDIISGRSYDIRVRLVDDLGRSSDWKNIKHTAAGDVERPPDITGFSKSISSGSAKLLWDEVVGVPDLNYYEMRFSSDTSTNWDDAQTVDKRVPRDSTSKEVTAKNGKFFIKAVDFLGRKSKNAATVEVNLERLGGIVYSTITEDDDFSGTKDNLTKSGGNLLLEKDGSGDVKDKGTYTFDESFVLNEVSEVRITSTVDGISSSLNNLIENWNKLTEVDTLSGGNSGKWDAYFEYRYSAEAPGDPDDFTSWKRFERDELEARQIEFRLVVTSDEPNIQPEITDLTATLIVEETTQAGKDISTSSTGKKSISFDKNFMSLDSISITINDEQNGDYFKVTNKDNTGFSIETLDSDGNNVSRSIDYLARGQGYQI